MANVTFVNANTGGNEVVSTSDIIVVKVYTDKVRVKYANNNIFATTASYLLAKAVLVANAVEILE